MDFLKAEIERKKRLIAEKSVIAGPEKKYFKRGDLATKEREEYLKRHAMPSTDSEKVKEIKEAKKEAKKALGKEIDYENWLVLFIIQLLYFFSDEKFEILC